MRAGGDATRRVIVKLVIRKESVEMAVAAAVPCLMVRIWSATVNIVGFCEAVGMASVRVELDPEAGVVTVVDCCKVRRKIRSITCLFWCRVAWVDRIAYVLRLDVKTYTSAVRLMASRAI